MNLDSSKALFITLGGYVRVQSIPLPPGKVDLNYVERNRPHENELEPLLRLPTSRFQNGRHFP